MDIDAHSTNTSWSITDALFSFPSRLFCYAVITFVLFQAVFFCITQYGSGFVGVENGPVEMAQVYLAIIASLCLFYTAYRCRRGRAGLIACAAMVGYAAARESDSLFEAALFDDAYKWLVGLPMLLITVSALWIDRRRVVPDAMWLVRQPSVTMFAIAGIYLCAVCQLFDRPDMWTEITAATEASAAKAMVEELVELFAYLLLAFSGVEGLAMAHQLDEANSATVTQDDIVVERPRIAA
ncbi:MAG: hypothetical protein WBD20_19060 [Pirellulaceae bacterium]